jgi:hypothetical protein
MTFHHQLPSRLNHLEAGEIGSASDEVGEVVIAGADDGAITPTGEVLS